MKLALEPRSPVPLYHQIAEAIRYRIATGRLTPGRLLPPSREAATSWGVNRHTVQRAYAELARSGLVRTNGAQGTRVVGRVADPKAGPPARKVDRFLQRVIHEARERHGLTQHDLAHRLANWAPSTSDAPDTVYVAECSESQCDDHCREIVSRWKADARPWCLSREGEPPPGAVVATYFHYNEIRRRWPHRLHEIRFVAIHPDPQLARRVTPRAGKGTRLTLTLCEFDQPQALNIAADLSVLFPADRYNLETRVVRRANELLTNTRRRSPVLFTPRVWAALSPDDQANPRAFKVRYVIAEEELDALGERFGLRRRGDSSPT